jgi:trehalose 6-phosphate synthase
VVCEGVRRFLLFLAVLVPCLALLAGAGYVGLMGITRGWFDKDLRLRSQLAVASASRSLSLAWHTQREHLTETLGDITRDERIMGAAACSVDGELLAATEAFPAELDCGAIHTRLRDDSVASGGVWTMSSELPAGEVHLSALPLDGPQGRLGTVLLVHDLSFLGRRQATTRNALIVAFFILAVAAALITFTALRVAWRGWTRELRDALSGRANRDFQPVVSDVRALVERLSVERDREAHGGPWSPGRLRSTLTEHLQGERVVIVANREPYIHERGADGAIKVVHPASGLVTALEPVMRACSGVWVAHGSGSADRQTVDAHDRVAVPPGEESYQVRRVWLSQAEENGYYYGLANEGLWPLCHVAHTRPVFRADDWQHYVRVNQKFATAVCEEVDSDDPIILVQDYHLALAPRMIRERLPRATILTFWHIPWPGAERLGICPWREELVSGLLGSSIVGFHTQQHCNNFIDSVDAFMESRIDRETQTVVQGARRTLVRPYPISIEWPVRWLAGLPDAATCRAEVRRELGLAPDALLGVGIDRLDYTKGIDERLRAIDELLTHHPRFRGRFTFAQLAAPSRTKIDRYRELNDAIEDTAAAINRKWGQGDYRPIVLLRAHHEPPTVFRYYRAADLCYVSSLHDGMNLVAKEFVAARDDEQGVLVLSQFTGAARELTEALIVNPYDLRQAGDALASALDMSPAEQRLRMQAMRRLVGQLNVYRWAGRMLVDAAELRRRDRLVGRLGSGAPRSPSLVTS